MGRHLLDLGLAPGRQIGEIVDRAYEAQLEGMFFDLPQALEWLRQQPLQLPEEVREKLG